jgi:alcohol dehydrogenase class IV
MVRPSLIIAEPAAMTGLPEERLRFSAMNALAHGADSLYTPYANPVSRMCALRGAELIVTALDQAPAGRDRAALAEGALLCAYAIDSGSFAIHHVVCQSLVRVCGSPHAGTNAAILPRAMAFMAPRAPTEIAELAAAIESDAVDFSRPMGRDNRTSALQEPDAAAIEARLLELGGNPPGLGALGADREKLPEALEAILARPDLANTPRPPSRKELEHLINNSW